MEKRFYLKANYNKKKFYKGNPQIVVTDNNERILMSYDTPICLYDEHGHFIRLWDDYSSTTMRHIKEFIFQYHFMYGYNELGAVDIADKMCKKEWMKLPVTEWC